MRFALGSAVALLALLVGLFVFRGLGGITRLSRRLSLYALLAGACAAALALYIERLVLAWTGLSFDVKSAGAVGALMATFLLAAPLEEGAKVLVVWPLYRRRHLTRAPVGVAYAAIAAAGFAAVEAGVAVAVNHATPLSVVRSLLSIAAHVGFAGAWGYSLGAERRRSASWFSITWGLATLLHGLFDHIVWGRGPGYLALTLPLLAFMALGAWAALRQRPAESSERPALLDPTSLQEMSRAIRATDKPVQLRWVVAGALVTLGLVITLVVFSVVLGRRLGLDFAVADEADVRSAAPLLVMATAVLLAFPIAGFLIARASSAPTVLEPALATLLALTALVAIMAMTAPVAVLFALAVAPIAFGLACGGAWVGLER